jgi:hypothetical protein
MKAEALGVSPQQLAAKVSVTKHHQHRFSVESEYIMCFGVFLRAGAGESMIPPQIPRQIANPSRHQ